MKVWMCTDGCYSDYGVKALYSTEAAAIRAKEAYGWENDPVEMDVDPPTPREVADGLCFFRVWMWADGDVERCYKAEPATGDDDDDSQGMWVDSYRKTYGDKESQQKQLYATCWARDEEHATKIINDRRIMSIANNYQIPAIER